ncbi:MAG: YggT family protein [Bacilli bacterium]
MNTIYLALYWALQVFNGFIVVSILLSWVPTLYEYKIFRLIRSIADWYLKPFRGVLVIGMFDLTPIIGIGIYQFIVSQIPVLFT